MTKSEFPDRNGDAAYAAKYFQKEYGHFIGGTWVQGASGERIPMINPANGQTLSYIQSGNAEDARRAVDAAAQAFPAWSLTPRSERQRVLYEMARRLRARMADYAMMDCLDNGKPAMEAMHFDLPMAIEQFEIFSGAPWFLHGQSIDAPNTLGIVLREPLGVVAQIIPWNVPLIMMAAKLAPALAAGNTVVLKPSEIVCLSVLEFFREMADLLPPGVVNVVTGYGPSVGEALVTHPKVRKVAFTGSRPTAQKLMQYASVNIIPQTMELGGKSANIVCEDADLDAAAEGAAMSTVLNKGEVCLAGSRVFVHEKVKDVFLDKFTSLLKRVKAGDPREPTTQIGPQVSRTQYDKILGYLELGQQEGAKLAAGGRKATPAGLRMACSSNRLCSSTSTTACASPRKKSSARSAASSAFATTKRWCAWQTTRSTVSVADCGPGTSPAPIASRGAWKPARSGSTVTTTSLAACRSAATSRAVSAASLPPR